MAVTYAGLSRKQACLHAIQNPAYRLTDVKLRAPGGIPSGARQIFGSCFRLKFSLDRRLARQLNGKSGGTRGANIRCGALCMNDFPTVAGAFATSFQSKAARLPVKGKNSIS
jgi:hypothetical protein